MNRRKEPSRAIAEPEPGFFSLRLVKGGPEVGARIHQGFGIWWASINGVMCGAAAADPVAAAGVFRVWTSGARIDRQAYDALIANPPASPDQKIDIKTLPLPF